MFKRFEEAVVVYMEAKVPNFNLSGRNRDFVTLAANEATVGLEMGAGAAMAVAVTVVVTVCAAPAVGSGAGAAEVVTGVRLRVVIGPCGLFGGSCDRAPYSTYCNQSDNNQLLLRHHAQCISIR